MAFSYIQVVMGYLLVYLPYRPIHALASILEQLHLSRQFTPQSLLEVSQEKILDIQKISQNLGYQAPQDFWSVLPELVSWVHQVGIEHVLKAEADLPWRFNKKAMHSNLANA